MTTSSKHMLRAIDGLKSEFYDLGASFKRTKDEAIIDDINALTTAINVLEERAYGRKITVITDCV